MKITIDEVPLSKNKYVNMHWAKRKKYKELISWVIVGNAKIHCGPNEMSKNKYPLEKATVTFDIYFRIRRKRDVANYLGGGLIAWLDVLVDSRYIADDCYECIGQPIVNFYIDKAKPRTEIIIKAVG